MDAFERVLRVEVKRRKEKGEAAPSFGDVKRLIEERDLFTTEEVKELKAQLKAKAVEICDEVYSSTKEESKSPEHSPKPPTKKRKADSTGAGEQTRAKKVKKEDGTSSKGKKPANKKQKDDSGSEMDVEMAASKPKSDKSANKKTKSKAVIDDNSDEDLVEKRPPKKSKRESDSDLEVTTSPPSSPEAADTSPKEKKKVIPAAAVAELGDSDLSVVEDGSPVKPKRSKGEGKKKVKSKEKDTSAKEKPPKGKGKASTSDNPDEEQIKRLKSFVVACGVRKKWAKEFEGIEEKPKKQIARLKEILEELGMTGRLSLEKAKAIRAKRELAEEIEEVVQFEARRGARDTDSKKSRAKVTKKSANTDDSEDEEELAANRPTRKKNPLAFLDDQSDDE